MLFVHFLSLIVYCSVNKCLTPHEYDFSKRSAITRVMIVFGSTLYSLGNFLLDLLFVVVHEIGSMFFVYQWPPGRPLEAFARLQSGPHLVHCDDERVYNLSHPIHMHLQGKSAMQCFFRSCISIFCLTEMFYS